MTSLRELKEPRNFPRNGKGRLQPRMFFFFSIQIYLDRETLRLTFF